jgi:hypothetical protein
VVLGWDSASGLQTTQSMAEYVAHRQTKWFGMRLANNIHGQTGGLQTHNTVQEQACKQNTIWSLIKMLY